MRIVRWVVGIALVVAAVAVVAPSPASADLQYNRIADVSVQKFATRNTSGNQVRMQPSVSGSSQEWVVTTGVYTGISMIITYNYPEPDSCLAVDPAGSAGSPLRLVSPCVAGEDTQEWFRQGYTDGTWTYRNHESDRCVGYVPSETNPVLRELTCDSSSSSQRFKLTPYI